MLEPWIGRRALSPMAKLIATLVVFHFVCFAWIFFRAEDFGMASLYISGLASGWSGGLHPPPHFVGALIALPLAGQVTTEAPLHRDATPVARHPDCGLGARDRTLVAHV